MPSQISIMTRVRKLLEAFDASSSDTQQQVTVNDQLELLAAQGAAPYMEVIKPGRAFEVHTTAAIAAVVAVPTTAAMLSIYNNEPDGGRSYIIDRCWALNIVSPATVGQAALIGCLGQTRVAALASGALAINALNGNNGKDTKAINAVNATALDAATGVLANWRLLSGQTGQSHGAAAATPGWWLNADVNGRIIVPPGRIFAIHVLGDVATETFTCGIEWHEKQLRLG